MITEKNVLSILNPQQLIERINDALRPDQNRLTLSGLMQEPVKRPLFPSVRGIPVCRVRYDVQQENDEGIERAVGFLSCEYGSVDGEEDGASYETMKLEMRVPLEIGGKQLPPSTIKVRVETSWCWSNEEQRRDHRKYFLGWRKKDFSSVLPTDWFYESKESL